ncbi:MAG: 4-hydroxythreonine-4-phosphate dehydrogenase PdxA, partial [Bacteroidaceae bacterium]|nr:4-hydroxythreonine-4-phosphate dehydrogenase PdxA [Bacteroidaceae bacterium]
MEQNKIRVAITQGDINGIGYEVILKAFEDPTMLELCTPIIYGSPKIMTYHRKAINLETSFTIINSASEVQHGKINVVNCNDDEVKVELGKPSRESGKAAFDALEKAMTEY